MTTPDEPSQPHGADEPEQDQPPEVESRLEETPVKLAGPDSSMRRYLLILFGGVVAVALYAKPDDPPTESQTTTVDTPAETERRNNLSVSFKLIYTHWTWAKQKVSSAIGQDILSPPPNFGDALPTVASLQGRVNVTNDTHNTLQILLRLGKARDYLHEANAEAEAILADATSGLSVEQRMWFQFVVSQSNVYIPKISLLIDAYYATLSCTNSARTIDIASLGDPMPAAPTAATIAPPTIPASLPRPSQPQPIRRRPARSRVVPRQGTEDNWAGSMDQSTGSGGAVYRAR
jgi:hypothetical protein